MRTEPDGRISAAAIYRRVGLFPYLFVIVMDVGKAIIAVLVASILTESLIPDEQLISRIILFITGFAVVVGHDWSVFLNFKGGLGATVIYGVLAGMAIWQFLIAGVIILIPLFKTRKSGLTTGILIGILCVFFLLQKIFFEQKLPTIFGQELPSIMVVYPLMLVSLMLLKRFQIRKAVPSNL